LLTPKALDALGQPLGELVERDTDGAGLDEQPVDRGVDDPSKPLAPDSRCWIARAAVFRLTRVRDASSRTVGSRSPGCSAPSATMRRICSEICRYRATGLRGSS